MVRELLSLRHTGSSRCRAWALGRAGSVVAIPGLGFSKACGLLLDQGLNPYTPALGGGFLTMQPPGKPAFFLFLKFCYSRTIDGLCLRALCGVPMRH